MPSPPIVSMSSSPIVCYVTDRLALDPALYVPAGANREAALLARIMEAVSAGVDWIQVREKDLEAGTLLDLVNAAVADAAVSRAADENAKAGVVSSSSSGPIPTPSIPSRILVRILINDRLDVACAAGAGGVHLGEDSLPIREVLKNVVQWKRATGHEDFLVGASCHSVEGGRLAAGSGADYIFFGPVFATPSKASFGPPQGLAALAEICRLVSIPVLAIGGITDENAAACVEAGAAGIAAIRWFQACRGAESLKAQITKLRVRLGREIG
jgi:thiamine-phosphate diphosphorylase